MSAEMAHPKGKLHPLSLDLEIMRLVQTADASTKRRVLILLTNSSRSNNEALASTHIEGEEEAE